MRDTIRGNAYYKSQTITMPKFLFTDETEFFTKRKALKMNYYFNIYYAIHEACHLIAERELQCRNHAIEFEMVEDTALAIWGLRIERFKAYPKKIFFNGKLVWTDPMCRYGGQNGAVGRYVRPPK